jgi:hypothetical protein
MVRDIVIGHAQTASKRGEIVAIEIIYDPDEAFATLSQMMGSLRGPGKQPVFAVACPYVRNAST